MGTVILIFKLLPAILQLVLELGAIFKQIQAELPAGVKLGALKKQIVMDSLTIAGADTKASDPKVQAAVSGIVDKTVASLNTAGVPS